MIKSDKLKQFEIDNPINPNIINGFFGEYRFLSNFHLCDITDGYGFTYPSTENAYMASKTNELSIKQLFTDISPGKARRLGQEIKIVDNWDDIRISMMFKVNFQKYTKYKELKTLLLNTGDKEIIEGNWWNDKFWGVCKGIGENNLGKILMEIRDGLRLNIY